RGLGNLPKANITLVDASTNILADAINHGDGGNIFIWSENNTKFAGNISAKGGQIFGNGGFAEISSKGNLIYRGQVDLSAINGNYGNLLLDPENIIIVAGTFADDDFQIDDNEILAGDGIGTFTISEGTLEGLSGNANVTLEATNNITVENLTDGILGFNVGTGKINFLADADLDGVGNFTMNTGEIQTKGRNISIQGANVTVNNINTIPAISEATIKSGNVNLTATNGNIVANNIDVSSALNQAGTVNLLADAIELKSINTSGETKGGNVTVTANTGNINVTDFIVTTGNKGNGGNLVLDAGGNIIINATNPDIPVAIDSSSIQNQGGTINLKADGNIQADNVIRSGGLFFQNGGIPGKGRGNTITINSGRNITAKEISTDTAQGNGANINLTATGDITTGRLRSLSKDQGVAGNISVNSSGKIDITGQILATSANLAGGNVTLKAVRNIDTSGAIFTNSENNSGAGGNVLIESTAGIVNLQQIETNGITAGNISLKGREINLLGGNNSVTGKGGEITILTANPDQNILLGGDADTGANILNLTNIDLRTFQNGWEQITI
ncbi:MAG: beta strand repeat-containing protein, partial [Microcoleaceae cyanobacterium]